MRAIVAGALVLAAGGCATWGPTWSEVTGERYHHAIMDRRPAVIEKIDGNSAFASYPIKLEPGRHEIVMQGPMPRWPGGTPLHTMTLDLQPCMRYYLKAVKKTSVEQDYTPAVDYVDPIAGCK